MLELRPNHAEVRVRKWWGVHNHIGTVHVIAVANGLEMAMGALAEATVPPELRWIPKGMELDYVRCRRRRRSPSPTPTPPTGRSLGEVRVRVQATCDDGTVAIRGVIRLHTSARRGVDA